MTHRTQYRWTPAQHRELSRIAYLIAERFPEAIKAAAEDKFHADLYSDTPVSQALAIPCERLGCEVDVSFYLEGVSAIGPLFDQGAYRLCVAYSYGGNLISQNESIILPNKNAAVIAVSDIVYMLSNMDASASGSQGEAS